MNRTSQVTPPFISYAQLLRLPNVFTAWADIFMGFLFTRDGLEPQSVFGLLWAASSLLYLAGMVLNDVYDLEIDQQERPERPLPSGRISVRTARAIGYALLVGGVTCGWFASGLTQDARSGAVATILAVAVLAYDRILKHTPLGPLAMGLCRFLNVLLGMSALEGTWEPIHWIVAAGLGLYIVGVTWFAKKEVGGSQPIVLALATAVVLGGGVVLAGSPYFQDKLELRGYESIEPLRWILFWIVMAGMIGWRFCRGVLDPRPKHIQEAVKYAILSLIMLNATMAFAKVGIDPPYWPVIVFALMLPARLLGQWIYST